MAAVAKILNHPKVFGMATDDTSPDPAVPDPDAFYIIDDEESGVVRVDHVNGVCCMVHIAALPNLWGRTKDFAKEALDWGFRNTGYMKVLAMVPVFNLLAIRLCKASGFKVEGHAKKSFLKNWELHNQILFGLTKSDFYKGDRSWQ